MKKARNDSKQIVDADVAVRSAIYTCLACGKPVFLKSAYIRDPHFAHYSATATRECKEYHWTYYAGGDASQSYEDPEADSSGRNSENLRAIQHHSLELLLNVGSDQQPQHFRLALRLSEFSRAIGKARIQIGDDKEKMVDLKLLRNADLKIAVLPTHEAYRAKWVSDEVDPEEQRILKAGVPGLAKKHLTFFGASAGRSKSRAKYLRWGTAYYVLVSPDVQPLVTGGPIDFQRLARLGQYEVAWFKLPIRPTTEIAEWISNYGGIALEEQTTKITVVSSNLLLTPSQGIISCTDKVEVVIVATCGPADAGTVLNVAAKYPDGRSESQGIELSASQRFYVVELEVPCELHFAILNTYQESFKIKKIDGPMICPQVEILRRTTDGTNVSVNLLSDKGILLPGSKARQYELINVESNIQFIAHLVVANKKQISIIRFECEATSITAGGASRYGLGPAHRDILHQALSDGDLSFIFDVAPGNISFSQNEVVQSGISCMQNVVPSGYRWGSNDQAGNRTTFQSLIDSRSKQLLSTESEFVSGTFCARKGRA